MRVRVGKCFDASPSEILASVSYVSTFSTAFGVGLTSASRSDTHHYWISDPVPPIAIGGDSVLLIYYQIFGAQCVHHLG